MRRLWSTSEGYDQFSASFSHTCLGKTVIVFAKLSDSKLVSQPSVDTNFIFALYARLQIEENKYFRVQSFLMSN